MRSRNARYRINLEVLLFLVLLLIPLTMMYFTVSSISPIDLTRYDTLRANQPDINIFTPENKTYTKPMNGYYPGVFGFENDDIGNFPANWTDNSGLNCSVQVIGSLDGHNNVIDGYDNSDSAIFSIEDTFDPQSSGTIEFWVRTNDTTYYTNVDFTQGGLTLFNFVIEIDKFRYYNGSWVSFEDANDNIWYHVRIDFDCTTGGYMGLSQYQYKIYINGNDYGIIGFWNTGTHIDRIVVKSHNLHKGYHSYFDAFGHSWDYFYDVGDNKNEGLLLSFDISIPYDWISYSFDQTAKRVIYGNITIVFPENGLHSIQIIGEDAGTLIFSDIRYFTVNKDPYIKITTPQNQTYYNPMRGYYSATFGFENDDIGNFPANWTDGSGSNCSVQVIDTLDGHSHVLDCFDNSDSNISSIDTEFSNQSSGTIEFWVRTTNATLYTDIDFLISGTQVFTFIIENEQFNYWNGSVMNYIANAYDNLWYHIKIEFECTTGGFGGLSQYQYKVYINDVDYGVINFWRNRTAINRIIIKTHYLNKGYHSYFDAFGFSWDQSYIVGDNLREGLLLSFKTDIAFDWIGYSLDGNMNKTILGNTTLVLPVDGVHRIQVFGVDWQGSKVQSTIRYFTINTNPLIEIITPKNQTYFGPMSSYYPGTFGFENDNSGIFPSHWIDNSGINCTVQVIDSLGGHNRVIDCYDNSGTEIYSITNEFKARQNGTVEFWVRTTDSALYTDIDFRKASITLFNIIIDEGKFRYYDGSWHDIENADDNIWYHIRIDFECTTGGYEGLSQYQYRVFINDIDYGALGFWLDDIYIDEILIKSRYGDTSYHSYFDAFGYSWDPNYNIGDNRKEGLILSFKSNIGLEWISYSLDGMLNKPILGNITIVMPEDGLHKIQIVGTDIQGITFYSNLKYFSISRYPIIIINSPSQYEVYGKLAPSFNLTILGQSLDTFWYTLDAGITNLTINELTGNIDQNEWNNKENGRVTITFYANNTQGFVSMVELIVIKCISGKTTRAIPGFDLFIIFSLFSIISMKLIKKWLTEKVKN
ncbi:MAG: hypothetical protein ACFE94_18405 [Candidatus Hodarchaeota archaeon]